MRFKFYFISVIITLMASTQLFSQNIKVGIGGGYAYIDNDTYYTCDESSNYFPSSLGLRNCYIINSKIKYIPSESPIIFIGELYFVSVANEADYLGYYSLVQSSPVKMHLKASQNIYSLGIGIEAPIIESFVKPYLSLGISANYFGKTKVERTPKPEPFFEKYEKDKLMLSDKLRAGLNIGLGVDYKFIERISVDISAKYNFVNLMWKKDISPELKEQNFNTFSITVVLLYSFDK